MKSLTTILQAEKERERGARKTREKKRERESERAEMDNTQIHQPEGRGFYSIPAEARWISIVQDRFCLVGPEIEEIIPHLYIYIFPFHNQTLALKNFLDRFFPQSI